METFYTNLISFHFVLMFPLVWFYSFLCTMLYGLDNGDDDNGGGKRISRWPIGFSPIICIFAVVLGTRNGAHLMFCHYISVQYFFGFIRVKWSPWIGCVLVSGRCWMKWKLIPFRINWLSSCCLTFFVVFGSSFDIILCWFSISFNEATTIFFCCWLDRIKCESYLALMDGVFCVCFRA